MERDREIDHLPSRVVGRRREGTARPSAAQALQETLLALRGGTGLTPRGLFRFASFEEAQEWMTRETSRRSALRRSTTSAGSAEPSTTPERTTS